MSQSRPLLGCLAGTFSPSRRQIRSTRLRFTAQPASPQQGRDPAVAVAAVPGGERDDVGGEPDLVVRAARRLALRGAVLAENPAGPPLGHPELGDHMLHAGSASGGAQK